MLKKLILGNFKSFGKRQVIPLAPITLIFGANSAGKSSILQSLLLLKQTLETHDPNVDLSPRGSLVDLGSYQELIHGHDVGHLLEIGVSFEYPGMTMEVFGSKMHREGFGLGFEFRLNSERVIEVVRVSGFAGRHEMPAFHVTVHGQPHEPAALGAGNGVTQLNESHPFWRTIYDSNEEARKSLAIRLRNVVEGARNGDEHASRQLRQLQAYRGTSAVTLTDPPKEWEEPDREKEDFGLTLERLAIGLDGDFTSFCKEAGPLLIPNTSFTNFLPVVDYDSWHYSSRERFDLPGSLLGPWMAKLNLEHELELWTHYLRNCLTELTYLGPVRKDPERHYVFGGSARSNAGPSGEWMPDLLFNWPGLVDQVNIIMRQMEIAYELRVHQSEDSALEDAFSLRLVDRGSEASVSLRDVGYGISQVLPIIVTSILNARGQGAPVLIEQPELHLHPRLQAEMGTMFAEAIRIRPEDQGGFPPVQFIIETHSEHLILRLQRLVREGKLAPTDLNVIYVTKGKEGSECHLLRMDSEGDFIDPWPEGFFEEGFHEMFASR